jgi:uracil-DNA glycosylase
VFKVLTLRQKSFLYKHGAEHRLGVGLRSLGSYHCWRYNTQTGRLTREIFETVIARAKTLLTC